MYKAKITYFKQSGKYYSDDELDLLPAEVSNCEYKVVRLWMIVDRVKELSPKRELPGITGDWLGVDQGDILITFPDELSGCPQLIKAN